MSVRWCVALVVVIGALRAPVFAAEAGRANLIEPTQRIGPARRWTHPDRWPAR